MTKHSNLFYEPLGQFLFQLQYMVKQLKQQEHKQLVSVSLSQHLLSTLVTLDGGVLGTVSPT